MLKKGRLTEWTILLPLAHSSRRVSLPNSTLGELPVVARSRVSETRFGVYAEPRHREAAAYLSGVEGFQNPSKALSEYRRPDAAVLVMYLVQDAASAADVTIGFGIQYPGQKAERAISWMVRDTSRADAVVIRTG
jgi:hypothetical protein